METGQCGHDGLHVMLHVVKAREPEQEAATHHRHVMAVMIAQAIHLKYKSATAYDHVQVRTINTMIKS